MLLEINKTFWSHPGQEPGTSQSVAEQSSNRSRVECHINSRDSSSWSPNQTSLAKAGFPRCGRRQFELSSRNTYDIFFIVVAVVDSGYIGVAGVGTGNESPFIPIARRLSQS